MFAIDFLSQHSRCANIIVVIIANATSIMIFVINIDIFLHRLGELKSSRKNKLKLKEKKFNLQAKNKFKLEFSSTIFLRSSFSHIEF